MPSNCLKPFLHENVLLSGPIGAPGNIGNPGPPGMIVCYILQ